MKKMEGGMKKAQRHKGTEAQSLESYISVPQCLCAFVPSSFRASVPSSFRLFTFCLCAFLSLCLSSFCLPSSAFPEKSAAADMEYAVKAGFIYSFTKFTQWPESAFPGGQEEFVIGVIGDDPFGNTLDALAEQKKVQGRRVVIKRFSSLDEITGCQILFISSSQGGSLEKILARVGNKPVLLIGDTDGFAKKGVDVNFFIQEKKVRFEFNLKALDRAGIKVSSQLLNLGKIIE